MIRSYQGQWPKLGEGVYVDASAQVIGKVTLGNHASVWMGAVLRGDVNAIQLGEATTLADHVTVGHSVTLHGCTVGSYCLIGIGAMVLNGAEIGEESIVAAGTLVPEGMKVPPRSLVMGLPAKVRREVTEAERANLRWLAEAYLGYKETYLAETTAASERPTPPLG